MKKLPVTLLAIATLSVHPLRAQTIVDVYDVTLRLWIPRVFDNSSSLGYRKYQLQRIVGELAVTYDGLSEPSIEFRRLENRTHRISGTNVKYGDAECGEVRWHYIGNNRNDTFKTPSVSFRAGLDPDYNISQRVDEDNSLLLVFSGTGSTSSSKTLRGIRGAQTAHCLHGYATGTLGCGCMAYGHISPTRLIGPYGFLDCVPDVAAVFGSWTAKFNRKKSLSAGN